MEFLKHTHTHKQKSKCGTLSNPARALLGQYLKVTNPGHSRGTALLWCYSLQPVSGTTPPIIDR